MRLAPTSAVTDRFPDPLTEMVDGERKALTVEEARETYIRVQRHTLETNGRVSAHERHRYQSYPKILSADRHYRTAYRNVTTVMLTRRLSPIIDLGPPDWLTPWELVKQLYAPARSVRRTLNYHLNEFEFEYVGVTAPTHSAATPHEHLYLWIEDPGNRITTDHIEPALNKHIEQCQNATKTHHKFREDGSDGAIRIEYDPAVTDDGNTAGATYVATQLAHLPLGDQCNSNRADPDPEVLEGGAIAWATDQDWFRSSSGVLEPA